MSANHDMHDDTAEFAASRFGQWPGEASTELGANPDRIGCGPNGTGPGPMEWLMRGLLVLLLLVLAGALVAGVA
jgi:hypothetical protein